MALPFRRQQIARFIPFHDFTAKSFADALNKLLPDGETVSTADVQNITYGRRYPSANVCRAIELVFGGSLPIHVYLELDLLRHYDAHLRLAVEDES